MGLERQGIPTITICWERFEPAARAQAKAMGMPSLPLVIVLEPRPWITDEQKQQAVDRAVETVIRALTRGN